MCEFTSSGGFGHSRDVSHVDLDRVAEPSVVELACQRLMS